METLYQRHGVAPFAGAWIEICREVDVEEKPKTSLPSRERGLKFPYRQKIMTFAEVAPFAGAWIEIGMSPEEKQLTKSRSLRGSVD